MLNKLKERKERYSTLSSVMERKTKKKTLKKLQPKFSQIVKNYKFTDQIITTNPKKENMQKLLQDTQ